MGSRFNEETYLGQGLIQSDLVDAYGEVAASTISTEADRSRQAFIVSGLVMKWHFKRAWFFGQVRGFELCYIFR